MSAQRLLLLDTSASILLAVAAADGEVLGIRSHGGERDGAAVLPAMIQGALDDAGWALRDLQGIGVVAGPGSYTGLRIGTAAAKGLCYALDIHLLLQDRLELLIEEAAAEFGAHEVPIAAILPARSGEFFAAVRAEGERGFAAQHFFEETLHGALAAFSDELIVAGPAAVRSFFSAAVGFYEADSPKPHTLARNAGQLAKAGRWADLRAAEPLYLKAAFTTQPKR